MTPPSPAVPIRTPSANGSFDPATAASTVRIAAQWMRRSTALWLTVAVAGQLLFGVYVLRFYGGAAWRGDFAQWSAVMPRGWVPGDHGGNTAVAVHLLVALVICVGGLTQLVPIIRRRAPGVHRWMGRAFVTSAVLGATSGFWLQWVRGGTSSLPQRLGTTTNGLVILVCALLAWRSIRRRDMSTHRRWALRLFLASNGVWFFRIGLMFTLLAFGRPVGFDPETFRGPLLVGLAWAETIVPLGLLELWLRSERAATALPRWAMSVLLVLLSVGTGMGVTGAATMLWLPHLR